MISTKRCAQRRRSYPAPSQLNRSRCTDTKAQVDRPKDGSGPDCCAERRPFGNYPPSLGARVRDDRGGEPRP